MKNLIIPVAASVLAIASPAALQAKHHNHHSDNHHSYHRTVKHVIHHNVHVNVNPGYGYGYGYPYRYHHSDHKSESFGIYATPGGGLGFSYSQSRSPYGYYGYNGMDAVTGRYYW
jgi:hypothetical protein